MAYPVYFLRTACIVEGYAACLLIGILMYFLRKSRMDNLFRIALCFWAIGNFTHCFLIANFQFIHIFRNCHFIFFVFNPLIGQVPREVFDGLTMLASAVCCSMFIFIPMLGSLQLMALTRPYWKPWMRFTIASIHTLVCAIVVIQAVPQLVPTTEFHLVMEQTAREMFESNDDLQFYCYGGTMNRTELNGGRHFLITLFGFITFPYVTSYAEMVVLMILVNPELQTVSSFEFEDLQTLEIISNFNRQCENSTTPERIVNLS